MNKAFDHLLPAFRANALLSAEERIAWIRQARWINYSRADQILARLVELLDYPPRDRMPCLLLFGATGMGKTHLIEKFLRDHRSRFDEFTGVTRLPVACIQMPPSPNERDFYEELLVGLRTVLPAKLSVTALASARGCWPGSWRCVCWSSTRSIRCWPAPSVSSAS